MLLRTLQRLNGPVPLGGSDCGTHVTLSALVGATLVEAALVEAALVGATRLRCRALRIAGLRHRMLGWICATDGDCCLC